MSTAEAGWAVPGSRYQPRGFHAKGGLGEIHRGEDVELHRPVALKRIQEAKNNADNRRRFLREAEITARLQHPGIAPVYGLVQDEQGRPCYAMRFIEGESLRDAIDAFHKADQARRDPSERNLALRRLLGRFVAACGTVAYAHSRGIMHLDLKPANIMLGDYDETLVVDWGLAGPFSQHGAERTEDKETLVPVAGEDEASRQMGHASGTPAYMSPEQAAGRWDLIGPASDIYSLGATLYAVLTGRAPLPANDPGGECPAPRQVKSAVPPALEAVCLKAMARRREDRYASVVDLAAEVEHWLADEPVRAYREPWRARLGRWARRHRTLVASGFLLLATVVVALAVGLAIVNAERRQTEQARAAEARRRQQALEALDLMSLEVLDDELAQQAGFTEEKKQYRRKALALYEEFARDNEGDERARAGVAVAYLRVANIQNSLGQLMEAEDAYRRSLEQFARLAAEWPAEARFRQGLGLSHNNLGGLLLHNRQVQLAEGEFRAALALQKRLADDNPRVAEYRRELARSHCNLGNLLGDQKRLKEAEGEFAAALGLYERLATDNPAVPDYQRELAVTHNNRGVLLRDTGHVQEAEKEFRAALASQRPLAEAFPTVLEYQQELARSHHNLGLVLSNNGNREEGEREYRAALAIKQRLAARYPTLPESWRDLAATQDNLGNLLGDDPQRLQDAEKELREALKVRERLVAEFHSLADDRWHLSKSHNNLGILLLTIGDRQNALAEFRKSLTVRQTLVDEFPDDPGYRQGLARSHSNLGRLLLDLGHAQEAAKEYREALPLFQRLLADHGAVPDYHDELGTTLGDVASLLLAQKNDGEARRLLDEALLHHRAALQANPRRLDYRQRFVKDLQTLAEALLGSGEHSLAANQATELAQVTANPAPDLYNAACYLSRCIPLAEKDGQLPEGRRRELAQEYADRALALLRQAVGKGYQDFANMKKDSSLDPLRSRDDFDKFLMDLEAKSGGR
jgi:serine/threonine-protein kinase